MNLLFQFNMSDHRILLEIMANLIAIGVDPWNDNCGIIFIYLPICLLEEQVIPQLHHAECRGI